MKRIRSGWIKKIIAVLRGFVYFALRVAGVAGVAGVVGVVGVTGVTGVTGGCAPATFQTARVEPGMSLTAGGGYLDYNYNFPSLDGSADYERAKGYRVETMFRYADSANLNRLGIVSDQAGRVAFVGQLGATCLEGEGARGFFNAPWDTAQKIAPWAELALQYQLLDNPCISFQYGFCFPYLQSLTFLCGIPSRGREIVTLGLKTEWLFTPASLFVTVHPLRMLHVSFQTNPVTLFTPEWELQAAMGVDLFNTCSKSKPLSADTHIRAWQGQEY